MRRWLPGIAALGCRIKAGATVGRAQAATHRLPQLLHRASRSRSRLGLVPVPVPVPVPIGWLSGRIMQFTGGSLKADHLLVVVHGLWGNPGHMQSVAKAMREAYSEDELYLLVAKRNSGSFTYDGIEKGGERVSQEIAEELDAIRARGGNITKLSIVGYSLGGLVARYAVGLLYAKGTLDAVVPMNFTTFATPHLGVRTPLRGWHNNVWNVLGARTLSESGKQLFTIDDFRQTGKPLLEVMASPHSIFLRGLASFRRRTLYANVVNDRTVVYYTAAIAKRDPFTDLTRITPNYVPGYEKVVMDAAQPFTPATPPSPPSTTLTSVAHTGWAYVKSAPIAAFLLVFVPIGIFGYLVNSVVQTFRSRKRIRLHETGALDIKVQDYSVDLFIKEMREGIEDAYETLNNSQAPEYLGSSDDDDGDASGRGRLSASERDTLTLERRQSHPQFPTLALAPCQFDMVNALDSVGWRKYPVWIHKHRHAHAAIIVRTEKKGFWEGHVVMKHWTHEEFLV